MSHIEHEGKVYCDWRLGIYDCEGSSFYFIATVYSLSLTLLSLLSVLGLFVVKILRSEESFSFRKFFKGDSLMTLFFSISILGYLIHFSLLLSNKSFLAAGIFWAVSCGLKFQMLAQGFQTMIAALPPMSFSEEASWYKNTNFRSRFIQGLSIVTGILHVVILSVSFSFKEKEELLEGKLEKAGLIITSFNVILIHAIFGLSCLKLIKKIKAVIAETSSFEKDESMNTILVLTCKKLQSHLFMSLFGGSQETVFFLLLALYPHFFTNLLFSQILFIITFDIVMTFAGLQNAIVFMVEIKSWIFIERTKSSSHRGSRKEEQSMERAIAREPVEVLIQELNPKN